MTKKTNSQVIVIGSINTDMAVKSPSLPRAGETVLGTEFKMSGGGKGANQAVAAARLGADVAMVASVGDDLFGKQAKSDLEAENIDCRYIIEVPNRASGIALINVDDQGENQIVVYPGANHHMTQDQVSVALAGADESTIVLLQLEIPLDVVQSAIQKANEKSAKVILDPAPAEKLPSEILADVFLLTPNQTEAEQLTQIKVLDTDSAQCAANAMLDLGIQNVALTMGNDGVLLANSESNTMIPATAVNAIDSTAAGDCFNGALASALSKGSSLSTAAEFACKAAAIAVTRLGAQDSMPSQSEI